LRFREARRQPPTAAGGFDEIVSAQKLDNSGGCVSELQIDPNSSGGIDPMSEDNENKEGSADQAKPTITIAERQSGDEQAKPTITIAERQGSDQDKED
jgi:hypothetical protein